MRSMQEDKSMECGCSTALIIIYPCSGSSDVGEISDKAARKLSQDGTGKMSCLAGIGGRVSGLLAVADSASKILVIDGCTMDCARKTLENAGYKSVIHLRLADIGMQKGKTQVTEEKVTIVVQKSRELLSP